MLLSKLQSELEVQAASLYDNLINEYGQITLECSVDNYLPLMTLLRDQMGFEQLIDLCGVDYSSYKNQTRTEKRFAVVSQLLSVKNNCRLRVRVFAPDAEPHVVPSVVEIYNSADWYEREAFDLFGITFANHPDLRRILTDYNFVGHALRKDFPVSGHMEMRYDESEQRVIYQPVTIEPRENTPRIVREESYGG
ncbi:MAG: NADH-quinone oxidoreductase subunit C [Neisseriaceae bacterium]|nr:NADH-quinone oxidoreductase subunit C [Neisseriaceae bacterium]